MRRLKTASILILVIIIAVLAGKGTMDKLCFASSIPQFENLNELPIIHPDYSQSVIPANIAPLNFMIKNQGKSYFAKIYSENGDPIEIKNNTGKIIIPLKKWHKLLRVNRGKPLYFEVFVKDTDNKWKKFNTITNTIARQEIDSYLCYRKIHPGHALWSNIGIYQRDISNFRETAVIKNTEFRLGCMNCHTFCNNNPEIMALKVRSRTYGTDTILVNNGYAQKIGAKFTYSAWHPNGKILAFSCNNIRQFYHSTDEEIRDVIDMDSLLAYYDIESNSIKTSSVFSRKEYLETYPAWSPDGRFLYFSAAAIPWKNKDKIPPDNYKVKYDIIRSEYNIDNDSWGQLETVVSSEKTELSALMSRISPDGKRLLFCMADYGSFPVYNKTSDLYLLNLEIDNSDPVRLSINSQESESWHCWSSNSRWIVFSSKRNFGVFTRLYISYIDEDGTAYKPFVLPQKNPSFYDSCLQTFNTPELIVGPVSASVNEIASTIINPQKLLIDMPITMATPKADGASPDVTAGQRE